MLSRIIHLYSVYNLVDPERDVHKKFQIKLDRSFSDVESFTEEYERVFKIFEDIDDDDKCPVLEAFSLDKLNTCFRYPLTDEYSVTVMEQGLENFRETASLVLTFNHPKIKQIKIIDKRDSAGIKEEVYEVMKVKQLLGGLNLVTVVNGSPQNLKYIVEQRDMAAHLLVQVSEPVQG